MSNTETETLSVVVEREIPFPPEKIWRALTQPHLIEEWLMKNDFKPVVDHRFNLSADWGAVDCQVLAVEELSPNFGDGRGRSGGGGCGLTVGRLGDDLDPVVECHTENEFWQLVGAVETAPAFLRGF